MCEELQQWVSEACERPEVVRAVHGLYGELQSSIDRRRPICVLSGRCCRLDEFGHRLYVTTAELAAFVADLKGLAIPAVAPRQGGCAFQVGKSCGVHAIRPMGCRIFFCDATATEWQREVYEQFHGRLKELHRELSIPYAYVEWRVACQKLGLHEERSARPHPGPLPECR